MGCHDQTETVDRLICRIVQLLNAVTELKHVDWDKYPDGEKKYLEKVNGAVTYFINPCQDLRIVP